MKTNKKRKKLRTWYGKKKADGEKKFSTKG